MPSSWSAASSCLHGGRHRSATARGASGVAGLAFAGLDAMACTSENSARPHGHVAAGRTAAILSAPGSRRRPGRAPRPAPASRRKTGSHNCVLAVLAGGARRARGLRRPQ